MDRLLNKEMVKINVYNLIQTRYECNVVLLSFSNFRSNIPVDSSSDKSVDEIKPIGRYSSRFRNKSNKMKPIITVHSRETGEIHS